MEEEKKKVSVEEEEKVDILDLLDAAAEFLSNPTDEQTYSRFNQMKANLVIRTFLPIEQKRTVMLKTLYDLNVNDMGGENVAVALEISLTFNGLFAYVVNVDYDISDVLKDEAFYDVFWVSGLGDYILGFCEKDFNRLKNMVTSMVSFENLKSLLNEISSMTPESIDKLTDSFNKFTLETNPETIKAMADIVRNNNPFYNSVADAIDKSAVNLAMKKQKEEREEK